MTISELPKGTIILEPQKIFNKAIVKYDGVLYYSLSKLVESFMEQTDLEYEQVIEHLFFNTWGYCPQDWPKYIDDL